MPPHARVQRTVLAVLTAVAIAFGLGLVPPRVSQAEGVGPTAVYPSEPKGRKCQCGW